MQRFLYFAGFTFIALCATVIVRAARRWDGVTGSVTPAPTSAAVSVDAWFADAKPYCNPVEVEVRLRNVPPPSTVDGGAYAVACLALAGKVDRARQLLQSFGVSARGRAAAVLFEIAHPVADAGDDRASGPMMELVLEYWPNNYMALYHAGMSEYALGQTALAEVHLRDFLRRYDLQDGFTANARTVLERLAAPGGAARPGALRRAEHDSARSP